LLLLGGGMTLAFVVLRGTNLYGNPEPFHAQDTFAKSVMAFLNEEKYPPSLQFLLMTIGPCLMLMAWMDQVDLRSRFGRIAEKIMVFGRVPLFDYVMHLFTPHLIAIPVGLLYGQPITWLWGKGVPPTPEGYGHSLTFVYLITLLIVALLYPACLWLARFKS